MKRLLMQFFTGILIILATIYPSVVSGEVRIGSIGRSAFNWHLYVMFNKDFLHQERVRAELIQFRSQERALSALATGSVHVLGAVGTDEVISNQIRGAPIIIVGGIMHKAPYCLVLGGRINLVKDLRGRYVGVSRYNSGLTVLLKERLERHRLFYPKDYRIIEIPTVERYTALQYGKISAALVSTPMAHRVGLKPVEDMARVYPQYQFTVTVMNHNWAERNRREAVAVMRGIIKSLNWLFQMEHRREAIDILQRYAKIDAKLALRTYDSFFRENQIFTKDAAMHPQATYSVINAMVKAGTLREGEYTLSRFQDKSYRNMALQGLR